MRYYLNYSVDELFDYSNKVSNIPYLSLHPDYNDAVNSLHDVLGKNKKVEFNKQMGHSNLFGIIVIVVNIFKEGYSLIIKHKGLGDEVVINYLQK